MSKHKVFVYGTLRPEGMEATHCINGFVLFDYYKRFPYIVRASGQESEYETYVYGNLLDVSDKVLSDFDRIEGIKHGLFERIEVDVYELNSDADAVKAFVYVEKGLLPKRIMSGDWREYSR